MMSATSGLTTHAASRKTDFQVLLDLRPEPSTDKDLANVAELAFEALSTEASGLALGPVASVDFERRVVQIEMTVEGSSAAEVHQKMALILGALERGAPFEMLSSETSRAVTDNRDLVCA